MTDQEWYDYGYAHCGIGVGDSVKVLRKAGNKEKGWGTGWVPEMDSAIGGTLTVEGGGERGFRLSDGYNYPFFVLELIQKKEPKSPLPQGILDIIDRRFSCEKETIKGLVAEILKQK